MKRKLLTSYLLLLLLFPLLQQCSPSHDRYDDPPWLGGTNIETLEGEGNYSIFLALMDRADYRRSIENLLFTLFVPSDSSFEEYFDEIGITGVEDLSRKEAEELFGQHILINPRSREQLMYEYAWGELQDEKGEYGTLFHRKETYSVPREYSETVKYNTEFKDQTILIGRGNTMIPLFTTEFFEDYFGDPDGSDYLFIYPESSWSGTQWHDAMVTEAEVRTSSGFLYYIDRVVKPVQTVETYLKSQQDDFGLFYDIAQQFANYTDLGFNDENERVYRKSYNQILNFAHEKGPTPDPPANMLYSFSAFVPYNHVLQDFLDETVLQTYPNLDSVPRLFLVYLLQSHLNSYLNLPSKMNDRFLNYFGDRIDLDVETDIATAQMCGNGVVYAMNRVLEPYAFTCVSGPIFYNSNYSTFLYMLEKSGLLNTLTRPGVEMTLFAPSNSELLELGYRYKNIDGDVTIEKRSSDGSWYFEPMEQLHIQEFVNDYIHVGAMEDFSGEGYLRMESDNYLYYNTGSIYSGGNQVAADYCQVTEKIASEVNGNLFYLDNTFRTPYNAAEYILNDPELTEFASLLVEAGLVDSVQADYEAVGVKYPRLSFMNELDQWTVFAPVNSAVVTARTAGQIPAETALLKEFIYYHFIRSNVVFDDGMLSGDLPTHLQDTVIGSDIFYKTLGIANAQYNLVISDLSGQDIALDHTAADKLIESGVLHKINSVLLPEN